jgi:hypothetical protein
MPVVLVAHVDGAAIVLLQMREGEEEGMGSSRVGRVGTVRAEQPLMKLLLVPLSVEKVNDGA